MAIAVIESFALVALKITPGNVDDCAPLEGMLKNLNGKVFADKGYIDKKLFKRLWDQGIHLITGIRKNMKNYLMPWLDKCLLRKRFIIETVFGKLKQDMGLEHSRHRSPVNAMVHVLSCLAAYCLNRFFALLPLLTAFIAEGNVSTMALPAPSIRVDHALIS